MNLKLLSLLAVLLLLFTNAARANPLGEAARLLEEANMERLHAQQTQPGVIISAFRTDGCSGGLSDSWKTLAKIWPDWARTIGEVPPWESCCVAHDRDYWRGESIEGFDKRLRSDFILRQCVESTGQTQADEFANRLGIPRQDVIEVFNLTAELMFHAVRVGGGPCTGLAWRWGHGWPPCDSEIETTDRQVVQAKNQRHVIAARPQTTEISIAH